MRRQDIVINGQALWYDVDEDKWRKFFMGYMENRILQGIMTPVSKEEHDQLVEDFKTIHANDRD